MPVSWSAGNPVTAAKLRDMVPLIIFQGADQEVANTTTPQSSHLAVTVDGLMRVTLDIRFTTNGGIRWAWTTSGTVLTYSRAIHSPGDGASGDSHNIAGIRLRSIVTLGEEQVTPAFTSFTSQRLTEELIVEGDGILTFQFAQETADPDPTTLDDQSYIIREYLRQA